MPLVMNNLTVNYFSTFHQNANDYIYISTRVCVCVCIKIWKNAVNIYRIYYSNLCRIVFNLKNST